MYLCPTTVKQVMKKKKLNVHTLSHKPVAKISAIVFYTLLGISALLFVLFRLVGFDMPYFENPEYNAPLLTGVLISYMLLLVAVALVLAVYSFVRSARINRKENRVVNNIPAHRIAVANVVGTAALLALTFALSGTGALTVNGARYDSVIGLRASGMFIDTSLALIATAIAAVAFGAIRNRR